MLPGETGGKYTIDGWYGLHVGVFMNNANHNSTLSLRYGKSWKVQVAVDDAVMESQIWGGTVEFFPLWTHGTNRKREISLHEWLIFMVFK